MPEEKLSPAAEAVIDRMREQFAYYWQRPFYDRKAATDGARALLAAYTAKVIEEELERRADEVMEKLDVDARVGRTWIAAYLRSFRSAIRARGGEEPHGA